MSNLVMKQVESGLESLFNRAVEVREGNPVDSAIKQRIADAARQLDRTGVMQAQLDVMTEAMSKLCATLYRFDTDGQPANFDRATGKINIPVPWGSSGCKQYGLRHWEATCFRKLLMARSTQARRLPPLFDYSDDIDRWFLNFTDYPTLQHSLQWIQKDGPKLAEWRTFVTEHRERDMSRKRRERHQE